MKKLFTAMMLGSILLSFPAMSQPMTPTQFRNVRTAMTRTGIDDVIVNPRGESVDYTKTFSGCYAYMEIEEIKNQETDARIVWGDDNDVYFADIITMMPMGTFIKGELSGDEITVSLPQLTGYEVYEYNGEEYYSAYKITLVKETFDGGFRNYVPEEGELYVTFTKDNDGNVVMNALEEGYALGLTMDDGETEMWMGFAEYSMAFAPKSGEAFDPSTLDNFPYSYFTRGYDTPDTAEPEYGYTVNVAFDGDDVYFTGLSIDEPSWWVKGHREGNRVILDNNQKMGTLSIYEVSLMFGKYDPEGYGGMSLLPADTKFVFNFDEEKKIFTTADPDVIMIINALPDQIMALWMLENPTLAYQPTPAGTPRDPWNFTFNAATYEKIGYGIFDFYLPIVSTDGVLLDRSNMYYQLYLDGEVFELDASEYGLPEDSENVPYNFDDNAIVCSKLSTYHEMIFHVEGFDKIGVKLFNVCDGVTYESNLVEMDVIPGEVTTAVVEISAGANTVGETFYDLSGRPVSNPEHGIFVKKTILDDGSVKTAKVIRK